MAEDTANPLVSTKPSDASLAVALHPLVLLTASDLITRHNVREMKGPIVGILLGQQKGQEITAEHAFPARLVKNEANVVSLHSEWTQTRIQQFKDVHKAPALDVVGWFTTTHETGPTSEHLHIQNQMNELFSDNSILLAIHPAGLASTETTNRKLPLTIYSTTLESDLNEDGGDMQVDGEEQRLKFRELRYVIETDETEMIAIDYVAKGAGSAAAIEPKAQSSTPKTPASEGKGKQRADGKSEKPKGVPEETNPLTTEEEDQIAGITTRLNSVKMLQSRLQVISKFVADLPPSYLSDATTSISEEVPNPGHLPHLRNIQALLARLSLLTPASIPNQPLSATQHAALTQKNDVVLTSLLAQLGHDVQGLDELGRKFSVVEQAKNAKGKGKGGFNGGGYAAPDDFENRVGGFNLNSGMLV